MVINDPIDGSKIHDDNREEKNLYNNEIEINYNMWYCYSPARKLLSNILA